MIGATRTPEFSYRKDAGMGTEWCTNNDIELFTLTSPSQLRDFFLPQKLRAHPIVCCSQHVESTPTTNTSAQTYYFGINQVFFKPGSEWMAEWSSDSILCGEQIVCECGFPVWNIRWSVSAPLLIQLIHKERTWRLTQNKKLYEEGMQHSAPIPDSCCAHTEWKRRRDDR